VIFHVFKPPTPNNRSMAVERGAMRTEIYFINMNNPKLGK
jgi:hypothetical protein